MSLERVEGPECPACGCTDAAVLRRGARWGQPWTRRRCNVCGTTWNAYAGKPWPQSESTPPQNPPVAAATAENVGEDLPDETGDGRSTPDASGETAGAVAYHLVRCPACHSTETRVTSTRRPIRYHRCADCGHTFKSRER